GYRSSIDVAQSLAAADDEDSQASQLIEQLKHPNPSVREKAADGLGKLGPAARRATEALVQVARQDQEDDVRCASVQALAKIRPEADLVIPLFEAALRDEGFGVRISAVEALADLSPKVPAATKCLEMALTGSWKDVREKAASVLLQKEPTHKEAIQTMLSLLKDREAHVRSLAILEIGTLRLKTKETT